MSDEDKKKAAAKTKADAAAAEKSAKEDAELAEMLRQDERAAKLKAKRAHNPRALYQSFLPKG